MFQQRAKITYDQLLKYSKYRAALETALNFFKNQVIIVKKYKNFFQYILIKIYIKIKDNVILAILNMKAYISVVTKLLAIALRFKWKSSTCKDIIAIDDKLQAAVGVVENILVVIANA